MADDWETAADAALGATTATFAATGGAEKSAAKNQWKDEDAPEPESKAAVTKGPVPPVKKKALSAAKLAKKEADLVRHAEAEAKARTADPRAALAHKQALIKLQEDAGKEDVEALFGGLTVGNEGPKGPKTCDPLPKTPAQFDQFVNDLVNKVLPTKDKVRDKTRKDVLIFLTVLLKSFGQRLDSDNLRELSSAVTVLLNDKIREETANKKKKPKAKAATAAKVTLNSNANTSAADEQVAAASGAADEYDFL